VTLKAWQSGWHRGQRQVTQASARVDRAVARSRLASLLLVRWYGHAEALRQAWSLFKRKDRFMGEVAQEAVPRTERQWQHKVKQFQNVASCLHNDPSLLSPWRRSTALRASGIAIGITPASHDSVVSLSSNQHSALRVLACQYLS
jgi:hypothetical protein